MAERLREHVAAPRLLEPRSSSASKRGSEPATRINRCRQQPGGCVATSRPAVWLLATVLASGATASAHAQADSFDGPTVRTPDGAVARPLADARSRPQNPPRRPQGATPPAAPLPPALDVDRMLSPGGAGSMLKLLALLTVLSLAPSILIMTTCFIRFVVVMGLLRQALGTQQLPPNQVLISLSLFLTFLVMAPVWKQAYEQGIRPYASPAPGEAPIDAATAFRNTARPLKHFMFDQIEATGNVDTIWTFLDFRRPADAEADPDEEISIEDLPLDVLLPAYMLSELKTAFVIGFQLYLPFLVIDMVVASILISMGMMMLPPVLVSLPFKLLLFVLIDGWHLVVGMLLESVARSV